MSKQSSNLLCIRVPLGALRVKPLAMFIAHVHCLVIPLGTLFCMMGNGFSFTQRTQKKERRERREGSGNSDQVVRRCQVRGARREVLQIKTLLCFRSILEGANYKGRPDKGGTSFMTEVLAKSILEKDPSYFITTFRKLKRRLTYELANFP